MSQLHLDNNTDNTNYDKWYKVGETISDLWNNIHIKRTILGSGLVGGMFLLVWTYVYMYWLFAVFLVVLAVYTVGVAAEAMME